MHFGPPDRRKCRTTKKQEEFYFNNLVEDGLTTYCRTCHNDKGSPAPGPDGSVPVRSGTRYNVVQPTKSEKHCKCGADPCCIPLSVITTAVLQGNAALALNAASL